MYYLKDSGPNFTDSLSNFTGLVALNAGGIDLDQVSF